MQSLILQTATRFLITLLLVLPIFLFVRGHNQPGGGFIAGLVATAAISIYAIAFDVEAARRALRIDPRLLIGAGLLTVVFSGILGASTGLPFLTGLWWFVDFPGFPGADIGTPLLFDLGVFLTVFGVAQTIIFALMEE